MFSPSLISALSIDDDNDQLLIINYQLSIIDS